MWPNKNNNFRLVYFEKYFIPGIFHFIFHTVGYIIWNLLASNQHTLREKVSSRIEINLILFLSEKQVSENKSFHTNFSPLNFTSDQNWKRGGGWGDSIILILTLGGQFIWGNLLILKLNMRFNSGESVHLRGQSRCKKIANG